MVGIGGLVDAYRTIHVMIVMCYLCTHVEKLKYILYTVLMSLSSVHR